MGLCEILLVIHFVCWFGAIRPRACKTPSNASFKGVFIYQWRWSATFKTQTWLFFLSDSSLFTLVEVFGRLAGVATAVGAALLLGRALPVAVAALDAGRRKATGSLRRWTAALLCRQNRLQELAAGHTLPVLLGKRPLDGLEGDGG